MCRSLLSTWHNEDGNEVNMGRGNAGVCTVNIPRIAIESNGDKEKFFKLLEERCNLAMDVVQWRYNRLITLKAKEAPFTYIGGVFGMKLDPEETVEKCFANGRGSLSLGFIGLHEATLLLLGEEPANSEEAIELQLDIMKHMNSYVDTRKKNDSLGYGIYSSPSEALTDRFCRLDYAKFGSIKGVTDKGFYINSYHINTETIISPFRKIEIEGKFQRLSQSGHISYVEMHNMKDNSEAYEQLVRYAYDNGLMYFSVNAPWDFCKTCHWTGELEVDLDIEHKYECPHCGEKDPNKVIMTRRLCGYLTTFNQRPPVEGRVKEIMSRVKHG